MQRFQTEGPVSSRRIGAGLRVVLAVFAGLCMAAAQAQTVQPDDGMIDLINTAPGQAPAAQGGPGAPWPAVTLEGGITGHEAAGRPTGPAQGTLAPLTTVQATRALCDAAVAQFTAGHVQQAFELLAPYWPLAPGEISHLEMRTRSQLGELFRRGGPALGYEWVRDRTGGDSLVDHLYLIKLPTSGLRFSCLFYKPDNHWQVNTVFWDDQIGQLLQP